jgi:hypothetical protein
MKLYKVRFKTLPTKDHPLFFECEFFYLLIWIYAENPDDAAERALAIISQLPYERGENKESWDETWRAVVQLAGKSNLPEDLVKEKQAKEIGLAILAHGLVIGADFKKLLENDPP